MNTTAQSTAECLQLIDEDLHELVYETAKRFKSKGLLVYENQDLSSSDVGHRFVIGYGPNNTITELPEVNKCNLAPPQGHAWQYYLVAFSNDMQEGEVL